MGAFMIIVFAILAVLIFIVQRENHEKRIYSQIKSMGGRVVSIERRTFSTGPFILPGRGRTVYRIEYQIGNVSKEGWVKFGGLLGPDWRL